MNLEPLVSVVTPVYNGQRYLAECAESVLRQTYSRWEYLIADNASTDQTSTIADEFAARDARIRVIHETEFVDVLASHNRAVRTIHPSTRYLKIVHADDWLYPECLERMVQVAEKHPAVGVVSSFRLVGNHVEHESPMPYSQSTMRGRDVVRWELFGPKGSTWVTGSDSSLMFRAHFVRRANNFYDPTVWHCDTDTAYRVLMESDFGFVHQALTFTRRHPGALTPFSYRVWSFITRDGRLLMRYGPRLLSAREYRTRIRRWLVKYAAWLVRQSLKPSRRKQEEFHEFHRREIKYMIAESADDAEVRLVLSLCARLLESDRGLSTTKPRGSPSAMPWSPPV
jgi:glycosyltransferase involved in cell wall biosynthesis